MLGQAHLFFESASISQEASKTNSNQEDLKTYNNNKFSSYCLYDFIKYTNLILMFDLLR